MKLGVLFSGGKDSIYACRLAMERDRVSCLITLISDSQESYMFHTPNIRCTGLQAQALNIPRLAWPTRGVKEAELEDLRDAIAAAEREYGIQGIVTGAIESVYQAARVQRICRDAGLWCFNPLWQADQLDHLRRICQEGYRTIISGVYAYPFDSSWLGAEINEERILALERLQERYQVNPSGEGGELETLVLDGPIFKKRIEVIRAEKIYANYSGRYVIQEAKLADK